MKSMTEEWSVSFKFEKEWAVGLFGNTYVKTSTEMKKTPTFLKEEYLYKGIVPWIEFIVSV